jgi:hypothetical protein
MWNREDFEDGIIGGGFRGFRGFVGYFWRFK